MPRFEHVRAEIPCRDWGCELLHLSTPRWTDPHCRGKIPVSGHVIRPVAFGRPLRRRERCGDSRSSRSSGLLA